MFAVLHIEEYFEKIASLLNVKYESRWDLDNPDRIIEKIPEENRTITWIDKWEEFEYGQLPPEEESDEHYFYDLVFSGLSNQKVLFLTHYAVYRKECFEFDLDYFYEFVEWYEDRYQMSFMQPQDYIVILENNLIKAIHHGGIIMEQHTPTFVKEIN